MNQPQAGQPKPPKPTKGPEAPPRREAPPAARSAPAQANKQFAVVSGRKPGAQRIVIYGPGGIGKSSLAALAPGPVFCDLEEGTREMDVPRVEGVDTFGDLRACLQSDALDGFKTIVIDTVTKAAELATAHTLERVKNEKGNMVSSIEGYGFGKGYQYVFDTFLLLLADCDRQVRQGRNVCFIAHDCTADVPNPVGDDYIRYEPHLQSPKSGKASIRNRLVQWSDHVLFVGYDVNSEDGKGEGVGTRTIYPMELPDHIAKSRILPPEPFAFEHAEDARIWDLMFGGDR